MLVEGINYQLDWRKFTKGASVFIPCLNPKRAIRDIKPTMKRLRVNVVYKISVYDGIRGVRMWRM